MSHSPIPWKADGYHGLQTISDANGREVCGRCSKSDAAILILAVNSHAAMREALEMALKTIRAWHGMNMSKNDEADVWKLYQQSPEIKQIAAALALVEEQP